jgi:perosamine synthetase
LIPLSVPNLKGREKEYVIDAIEQEWVSTGGAYIERFSHDFAEYAGISSTVACQSGTAALHLILHELGIGTGDLVVAPTLTFIATINPIRYMGAEPVFMDCDETMCLDAEKLEAYFAEDCEIRDGALFDKELGKPIKAVVVVHVFGNIAYMERISRICKSYGVILIEDAAEAVGSFFQYGLFKGKMAGAVGDFGYYSFNGNKIITTGGGGMVTAKDDKRLEHIKFLSTQAKSDALYFSHDEVGFNYRMTNLQAALGVAQIEQLETFIETKKENYKRYIEQGIPLFPFRTDIRPNYWMYSYLSEDRDRLINELTIRGIQARPVWKLNHTQKPYEACKAFRIEKAQSFLSRCVNLPCSSNLSSEDVDYVANAIKDIEKPI